MRTMDFTTEQPDCCSVGDYLEIVEHELPTSYWYMLEHAYGASTNFKNRERLKARKGKVIKIWKDDRFNYITLEFDEEDFRSTEDRLNTINHLKGKYGNTIEEILRYKEEKEAYLEKLADYDAYMQKLNAEWEEKRALLKKACEELSEIRRKNAAVLTQKLKDALIGLNFLTVEFDIAVRPGQAITTKGYDDVEFLISTNPGESLKPLNQVASGGELSRVMLAIKTVLAGKDAIDTLIFDEIDTGISGRTAWKVAEQLSILAGAHQVICITHLPQIAAMADVHFIIEKSSTDDMTITDIHKVAEEESLAELARLLGSDALTEAALSNAKEMKEQANGFKEAR